MTATDELRSDRGAPDDSERYFLFQTLAGVWPIELERLERYMEKSLREAKRNTSWVDHNTGWERDVLGFCGALYTHHEFRADFEPFVDELARDGDRIALAMIALKLTTPGLPDIYQGDEMEFRALVDPDNRRAVDWSWNRAMLARLQGGSQPDRQTAKLWLTMRLLHLRIRRPDAFAAGYEPLDAGPGCVSFLRGGDVLVVVATRRDAPARSLTGVNGSWRDVLRGERWTFGERVPVRDLLGRRGLAVFERAGP
jgi:(1->4)-alpha-D-glucan 1-alpha-D-glucosylmutase